MKKRILCILLVLAMAASMLPLTAAAAFDYKECDSDYFYDQLNDRQQAIYKKLLDEFTGSEKSKYYEGTEFIDIFDLSYGTEGKKIDNQAIEEYKKGNKDLFNDFCAAKDALDLDHSELWYIDSGYLTFQVTQEGGSYHVLIGPGRGPTYLLGGTKIEDVKGMDADVTSAINSIVTSAVSTVSAAESNGTYSEADRTAALVTAVHDQIVHKLHYRYETECREDGKYAKYIRTVYGIVSHEGVCEAYARTLQVCLTKLGIECVLVHGVQTKGTPEDHMWNAVNIPNADGSARWYVVDATWDDPLTANWDGTRDLSFKNGEDGKETNTYLLVGQSLVGEHWRPSGYVSTGNFEFKYPTIETAAYSGVTISGDDNGLKVDYSTGGSVDGVPAGVFTVTYKGMDAKAAREKGFYFMTRMYDYHSDGTADVMEEWYYADAVFILSEGNPYFGDYDGALRIYTPTCEYVEIAVTTREPDHRSTWSANPATSYLSNHPEAGFFHGDESEIIAQSGLLYNVNSKYEAPPYVATQTPAPNGNSTAGYDYRFRVTYDDDLYHILPDRSESEIATVDAYEDNSEQAAKQDVCVRYTTIQQDLHTGGDKYVQIAGELPFDTDRDGVVDMDAGTNKYVDFKWIYSYEPDECPNTAYHANHPDECDVEQGCPIIGVEFNFRASTLWIDDITEYNFAISGVVGSRSGKFPNNFATIAMIPGLCPACYRSQGIDWNLWGQPTLLDAPENLNLESLASADGDTEAAKKALEEFNKDIHRDDINGRLMLVVEDKSKGNGNREDYEKIQSALDNSDNVEVPEGEVIGSSVFEINFNRVCPMVKLKPNKGESLRVQVGYPAGVTYESLGNGEVELKAYHFTRCARGTEDLCDEYKRDIAAAGNDEEKKDEVNRNHKWGEHIISVEEITIIPTPYGMVIMCDAFSPFEIVAVKKPANSPAAVAETGSTLIVVSDGNGKVTVDGEDAVGDAGNVEFASKEVSKTFKVEPAEGYEVDTVTLGGSSTPITVGDNGEFTVTGVEHNDVLSVTFIPTSVKTEEAEKNYGTTVVATVCPHTQLQEDPNDHTEEKDPTCTEAGYRKAQVCTQCGQTVIPGGEIPATGHTVPAKTASVSRAEVTCTKGATIHEVKCTVCQEVISKQITVPALGHDFENYRNVGEPTCKGQQMTGTCTRCKATDTITNKEAAVDHDFTVKSGTASAATCYKNEVATYKCRWCDKTIEKEIEDTQLPHENNGNGYCTKCGNFICDEDGHKWENHPEVAATCTDPGSTGYRECTVCHQIEGEKKIIPAKGHSFNGHTKGSKCAVCGAEMQSDEHTPENIPDVEATCDTQGSKGGTRCSSCGEILEQPTIVEALGHDWDEKNAVFTWAGDGTASAFVTVTCKNDPTHTETLNAAVEQTRVIEEADCAKEGSAEYTATVTLSDGDVITDTRTLTLPKTEHTPDAESLVETPATCAAHATRTYKCSVCDTSIFETVEGELPAHDVTELQEGTIAPTCTTDGLLKGVCSKCHETVEQAVPATGHNYINGVCTRCGQYEPYYPPVTPPVTPAEPEKPWVNPYPDVPETAWYMEDLEFADERGLIKGFDDGTFKPGSDISRAQIMTILARLSGVDTEGGEHWYDKGVEWAKEQGISDGTNLSSDLTRQELATMLYRFADEPEVTGDLSGYTDASSVSSWARDAMIWAVQEGIIKGTTDTTLNPRGHAARSHVIAMLARFCRAYDL